MWAKCPECKKEYDSNEQVLCPHYNPEGKLYYINVFHKDNPSVSIAPVE